MGLAVVRCEYRLLVTGSRDGFPSLWDALDALVAALGRPVEVHVREQDGVDVGTRAWVAARGLYLVPEQADPSRPSPERYHEANQRMVDKCARGDVAAAFPRRGSRGTWQCLGRARRAGLRCYVADLDTRRLVRDRRR